MIKIGEILENGEILKANYIEGLIFKDEEAFINRNGICYVSEQNDKKYTYDDFLNIGRRSYSIARILFCNVTGESPSTLYDELVSNGEIIECDTCRKAYLSNGNKDMECPYCSKKEVEKVTCKCHDTNCILSVDMEHNGQKTFADLRFDLDDKRHELDINLGVCDGNTNKTIKSSWSESLPLRFCPFCGIELKYRDCYK